MPAQATTNATAGQERAQAIEALHAATAIYTAEPVVGELFARVGWPACGTARLVDPSAGDGVFLGQALHRLLSVEPDLAGEELASRLEGWEVHPQAAAQARARVARVLTDHGWPSIDAQAVAERIVRNADFLTDGPHEGARYDVIVGNPPYLRAVNVPPLLRAEYRQVSPDYARADLLHTFLERCARLLRPGGVVAMVTADRWLFNLNAARLRQRLGRDVALHHVERLDPATSFYRPKQRRRGTPPRIHPVAVVLGPRGQSARALTDGAIYPDQAEEARPSGPTLADVAIVRQGPWLGAAGIFLVDEQIAAGLPAEHLVPAVGPRDVRNGVLGPIRRWAIRTRADEQPPREVLAHLDSTLHRMAPRGRRTPRWLPPESWGELPYDRPCLMIRRIAKRLEPVRLPAGVLATNHDVTIVASAPGWPLERIEAVLRAEATQRWLAARAPSVDGGYRSMTTTLLRQIPMGEGQS